MNRKPRQKPDTSWYEGRKLFEYKNNADVYDFQNHRWLTAILAKEFILYCHEKNRPHFVKKFSYFCEKKREISASILSEFDKMKYKHIMSKEEKEDKTHHHVFLSKTGFCRVYCNSADGRVDFEVTDEQSTTIDNEIKHLVKTLSLKKEIQENDKKMYIIGQRSSGGLCLQSSGIAAHKIDYTHYSEDIHKNIEFALEELNSPDPFGRLIILEGPAGTGKTFLVRGFIDGVENGKFIFVPSGMISQLSNPSLVTLLLNHAFDRDEYDEIDDNEDKQKKPLILLLEDADKVLLDRKTDNLESISTLLNLTSGILGDSLDIRIVATTNSKIEDFDKAIKREGRLSCYVYVDKLNKKETKSLYKNLVGKEMEEAEPMTLAQIYKEVQKLKSSKRNAKLYKDNIKTINRSKKKTIGF